jgi:Type III secretion system translocator protein, HrpF
MFDGRLLHPNDLESRPGHRLGEQIHAGQWNEMTTLRQFSSIDAGGLPIDAGASPIDDGATAAFSKALASAGSPAARLSAVISNSGANPSPATPAGTSGTASASPTARGAAAPAKAPGAGGGAKLDAASGAAGSDGSDSSPVDSAIDNSQYSSAQNLAQWAPLVAGLPADQRVAAEKALNRPIAVAKMLAAGGNDAKTAQAYLAANPAVKAALDTAAHGGAADGNISSHDISSFISTMQKQLGAAADTLSSYQQANPDADGQSLELVRQAALLQANLPITNAADPSVQGNGDKATGMTTQTGLLAIVNSNPGLSAALKTAGNLFTQPGMFAVLDQGGLQGVDLATHNPDNQFNEKNITDWVKSQAPTTGGQFASLISDAATRGAVSGVDTSNLNGAIFTNPKDYTGAQKAAALVQLQTTQAQVEAGSSLRKTDETDSELQQRIAQLQADPDVSAFLQQSVPQNEASIINSDSSLATAVQTRYVKDIVTGAGLQKDLDRVNADNAKNTDPNAPKESAASAVQDFSTELQLQTDLHPGAPTLEKVVAGNAALTSRLQSDYISDFSKGGEIKQLLSASGAAPADALSTVQGDEQAFESALDPAFVQSQSNQYSAKTAALLQPALIKSGSGQDVLAGLGGGPANLAEISKSVAASLSGQGQSPFSQADTQALINSFLQDLKSGTSLQDALAKVDPTSPSFDPGAGAGGAQLAATLRSNPNAASQVQALLTQVASSALLMNAQAAGGAGGGGESSDEKNQTALGKATYGLMGGEISSGIIASRLNKRGAKAAAAGDEDAADSATAAAAKFAIARDVLGGVGGLITAVLTLPSIGQMIKSGQSWQAALDIGAAGRGIVAASTTSVDGGILVAKKLAGDAAAKYTSGAVGRTIGSVAGRVVGSVAGESAGLATTEALGTVLGPAGVVLDGVLGAAFIITLIVQAVKKAHEKKAFDKTVDPTLEQYGITTPS